MLEIEIGDICKTTIDLRGYLHEYGKKTSISNDFIWVPKNTIVTILNIKKIGGHSVSSVSYFLDNRILHADVAFANISVFFKKIET